MKELIPALIKARAGFVPIKKDRTNPFLKNKYATLDSVISSIDESLQKNGLIIAQAMEVEEGATILATRLYHESGEVLESRFPIPENSDPQKLGAYLTYVRRYAICALLNLVADEDTDAEGAKPAAKSTPPSPAVLPVSAKRQQNMTDIEAELKRLDWSAAAGRAYLQQQFGKSTRKELTDDELNAFLSDLKKIEVAS